MRPLRILRRAAYTILAPLLALFVFVQFQQRLLRHRAERLLDDFRTLQQHPGSFADLQWMQKRWGSHGRYDGTCTAARCVYVILLGDTLEMEWKRRFPLAVRRAYKMLGGRDTIVYEDIALNDNRIWQVDYRLMLDMDFDTDSSTLLSTELYTGSRLLEPYDIIVWRDAELKRDYEIGRPDGCEGCIDLWVRFDYRTPGSEVSRLSNLQLDCITRWKACETEADLNPVAFAQHDRELPQSLALQQPYPCSSLATEAREADNAVIAESIRETDETYGPVFYARVLQVLKRSKGFESGSELTIQIDPLVDDQAAAKHFLMPGTPYIVFAKDENKHVNPNAIQSDVCATFPATTANLALAQKGIALDYSHGARLAIVDFNTARTLETP